MSSESSTSVSLPKRTPEEQQAIQMALALAQQQLDAIKQFGGFQQAQQALAQGQLPGLQTDLANLTGQAGQADQIFDQVLPGYMDILQREIGRFSGGQLATPQELSEIDAAIAASREAGGIEIDRATEAAYRDLFENVAPSRGFKPGDTPILDRGGLIASEGLRQRGTLESTLAGQRANARLALPAQRSGIMLNTLGFLSGLQQQRSQLAESAFLNRLRLTGQIGQQGLGLATGIPANIAGLTSTLGQERIAGAGTTTSSPFFGNIGSIGQAAGGIGGLLTGGADLF